MPPTIAARWMTCEQPLRGRARLVEVAQVAGVDLAALAHPVRRLALVGDADLVVGVAQQAADDGRADRAGAAGDEDAVHAARDASATRAGQQRDLVGVREDLRGAPAVPRVDDERVAAAPSAIARSASRRAELGVVGGDDDGVGVERPRRRSDCVGVGTCGSWTATSASSRSSRRMSLCDSESRSSSVSALNARPEHRDLAARAASPRRRLRPSTRNSGTDSLTRETASSMPGALRALLARRRSPCAGRCRR